MDFALQKCVICRRLCCQGCAVEDFGRAFCSKQCRDYFFHGDEVDDEYGESDDD